VKEAQGPAVIQNPRTDAEFRLRNGIHILLIWFADPGSALRQFSNLNQQCEPSGNAGRFREGKQQGRKPCPR
jgi:hypothetical protein